MRFFITLLAYVVALAVVAVIAFFSVLVLAGPHGGVLPNSAQPAVLIIGWLTVIVVPAVAALRIWHGTAKRLASRRT